MQRLLDICNKPSRVILGLMSGTSYDGVDAALVKIHGSALETRVKLLCHLHIPYPSTLRSRIASSSADGRPSDICRMNFELGEFFAKAAMECITKSALKIRAVDAIASHGQTIYHIPPELNRKGSTLQIGESSVIAQRTGLPVISDFRTGDMAQNGHGAPLVPYADYILFHKKGVSAVQNIGGISNVTVVTPEITDVIAFDTGPGNCLINEAMTLLFKKPFDRNGSIAKIGKVEEGILKVLLSHPYFTKRPPKSTGREIFGKDLIGWVISKKRMRPEDLIATLTHFTAHSIKSAYDRFILKEYKIHEVIISGGGSQNLYLVSLLKELFKPIEIISSDDYGIPAMAKEAMSFAILANETLSGNPSNLPRVTGASKRVILGKLTLP